MAKPCQRGVRAINFALTFLLTFNLKNYENFKK